MALLTFLIKLIFPCNEINKYGEQGHAEVRLDTEGHFIGMTVCFRSMIELCSAFTMQISAMDMTHSHHTCFKGPHCYLVGRSSVGYRGTFHWHDGVLQIDDRVILSVSYANQCHGHDAFPSHML
jgi:hypothetical protein